MAAKRVGKPQLGDFTCTLTIIHFVFFIDVLVASKINKQPTNEQTIRFLSYFGAVVQPQPNLT